MLGDPFEFSIPNWAPALIRNQNENRVEQMPQEMIEVWARSFQQMRKLVFVNCWYSGDRDSAAMWATFGSPQDGVAVRSTVARLSESIILDRDAVVGEVAYFDYSLTEAPPEAASVVWNDGLNLAYMKRDAFGYEQEVRAVFRDGAKKESPGVSIPVDLTRLVAEVTVAPFAEQWFVDLVEGYLNQAGISVPVGRSKIGDEPNWRLSVPPGLQHLPVMQFGSPLTPPDS